MLFSSALPISNTYDLNSTFTASACGEHAKGYAIREMEALVEAGSLLGREQGRVDRKTPKGAEAECGEHVPVYSEGVDRARSDERCRHNIGDATSYHHPESRLHQQHRREHNQQQWHHHYYRRHGSLPDTSVNVAVPNTSSSLRPSPLSPHPGSPSHSQPNLH